MKKIYFKRGLLIFACVWCVCQIAFQYFLPLPKFLKNAGVQIGRLNFNLFSDLTMQGISAYPLKDYWYLKEIVEQVHPQADGKSDLERSCVLLLVDHMYYNANTLAYEAKKSGAGIDFISCAAALNEEEAQKLALNDYDYIVYRPATYQCFPYLKQNVERLYQAMLVDKNSYHMVRSFSLPDGETLSIYQNDRTAAPIKGDKIND